MSGRPNQPPPREIDPATLRQIADCGTDGMRASTNASRRRLLSAGMIRAVRDGCGRPVAHVATPAGEKAARDPQMLGRIMARLWRSDD